MIGLFRRSGVRALIAACLGATSLSAAAAQSYDLTVAIDPATRELRASASLVIAPGAPAEIYLARRFQVDAIAADGRLLGAPRVYAESQAWSLAAAPGVRVIEVRWHGRLAPLDTTLDARQVLSNSLPATASEGTFLPAASQWYPQLRGQMNGYLVTIELPQGQRGLVPGRLIEESENGGRYRARFEFAHPAEGIDLIAGPYQVETRSIRTAAGTPLALRTYFHPQIAALATGYLDSVKDYIDLYERLIGAYPYTEFSIVSSPTPTGFGMPTLTYLGIDVLRLPFIRTSSLGHEILHNWWGNGVYPDYQHGNWSEALTTFMADYAYREREGAEAARRMRLEWLRDFSAVPAGTDRPLAEFTSRTHGASQIVGYDKGAMIFLMLRDLIGGAAFEQGIQRLWRDYRFRSASWDDLRRSFEAASGRDLSAFFAQWLRRAGAPQVRIATAALSGAGGREVQLTLAQAEPAYSMRVPVTIRTEGGAETRVLDLSGSRANFSLELNARALALELDPDLQLFRRLNAGEAPPILRQVMLDPAAITVGAGLSGAALDAARSLADALSDHPARMRSVAQTPAGVPLLIIGLSSDIEGWLSRAGLPGRPGLPRGKGSAMVWTAALPQGKSMMVVEARDAQAIAALVRPLPHYGRQSYLVFDGSAMIESGVWPAQPQVWRF